MLLIWLFALAIVPGTGCKKDVETKPETKAPERVMKVAGLPNDGGGTAHLPDCQCSVCKEGHQSTPPPR